MNQTTAEQVLKSIQSKTEQEILTTLNNCTIDQIMKKVIGLGKKRATKIVDERDLNGQFLSVKELSRAGLTHGQISQVIRLNLTLVD